MDTLHSMRTNTHYSAPEIENKSNNHDTKWYLFIIPAQNLRMIGPGWPRLNRISTDLDFALAVSVCKLWPLQWTPPRAQRWELRL